MDREKNNLQTYCPSCGKLVSAEQTTCPSCGMWLRDTKTEAAVLKDAKKQQENVPLIRSSLPSQEEVRRAQKDSATISSKFIAVAVVACVVLICGAILFISHPWDPNAFSLRANAPADTSQDGFPGEIDSLSAQDSNTQDENHTNPTENELYTTFYNAYRQLGDLKTKTNALVSDLESVANLTTKQKDADYQTCTQLSQELTALRTRLEQAEADQTSYASTKENILAALTRLDVFSADLLRSFKIVHASEDLAADKQQLDTLLDSEILPSQTAFIKAFKAIEVPKPS